MYVMLCIYDICDIIYMRYIDIYMVIYKTALGSVSLENGRYRWLPVFSAIVDLL